MFQVRRKECLSMDFLLFRPWKTTAELDWIHARPQISLIWTASYRAISKLTGQAAALGGHSSDLTYVCVKSARTVTAKSGLHSKRDRQLPEVAGSYLKWPAATWSDRQLPEVTDRCLWPALPEVTGSYLKWPAPTWSDRQLPEVTGSYLKWPAARVPEVTGSYLKWPAATWSDRQLGYLKWPAATWSDRQLGYLKWPAATRSDLELPEVTAIMKNLPPLALPDPGDYDEVKATNKRCLKRLCHEMNILFESL